MKPKILLYILFTLTTLLCTSVNDMGRSSFGNVPGLQVYVVQRAEIDAPQAVDVASGSNIAAFNVGIAGGAWIGGLIVAHYGLMNTPWIGALVVLGALALTTLAGQLDKQDKRELSDALIATKLGEHAC